MSPVTFPWRIHFKFSSHFLKTNFFCEAEIVIVGWNSYAMLILAFIVILKYLIQHADQHAIKIKHKSVDTNHPGECVSSLQMIEAVHVIC